MGSRPRIREKGGFVATHRPGCLVHPGGLLRGLGKAGELCGKTPQKGRMFLPWFSTEVGAMLAVCRKQLTHGAGTAILLELPEGTVALVVVPIFQVGVCRPSSSSLPQMDVGEH